MAYMVHATTVGFLALKIGGYVLVFPFFPPVSLLLNSRTPLLH